MVGKRIGIFHKSAWKFDVRNKLLLLMLFFLFCLPACSHKYPLDIPENEWTAMTGQEQLRAREKQAELEKAEGKRRAEEARARQAEAIKWLKDKEASREQARYGDRLQCVLTNARAYFWDEWRSIEPVALDIVKGMVLQLELSRADEDGFHFSQKVYAGLNDKDHCMNNTHKPDSKPKREKTRPLHSGYLKPERSRMKKSLVTDDDPNILTTLEIYLEDNDFTVFTADCAEKEINKSGILCFDPDRKDAC